VGAQARHRVVRSGSGLSPPLAFRQSLHDRRRNRGIQRTADPQPRSCRKLDFDHSRHHVIAITSSQARRLVIPSLVMSLDDSLPADLASAHALIMAQRLPPPSSTRSIHKHGSPTCWPQLPGSSGAGSASSYRGTGTQNAVPPPNTASESKRGSPMSSPATPQSIWASSFGLLAARPLSVVNTWCRWAKIRTQSAQISHPNSPP
jgi:hypothetical protein